MSLWYILQQTCNLFRQLARKKTTLKRYIATFIKGKVLNTRVKATFLGHSAWQIVDGNHTLLIDPFLTDNPVASIEADEVHADYILVTHAHGDHLGDTADISKRCNALVISTNEIAVMLEEQGVRSHGMHLGGTYTFPFGRLRVTPAFHGSGIAGGHAAGFIIRLPSACVYHSGDTSLFGDMKLLGELEDIDLAMLPIGGNYTMDWSDAARAVQMLQPQHVVPMHYNTFPVIETDPEQFRQAVQELAPQTKVSILQPGESVTL